jgi:hypothetical protein
MDEFHREQARKQQVAANLHGGAAPDVTKVPNSNHTSDDERPSQAAKQQQSKKRPNDEVDFDAETLKTMSYADLDVIPFLTDPRGPAPQTPVDANGVPITLEQRLTNLSRMSVDDQKSFFRSLSDADNENVGQWFVQSFGNDLKKLMEVRLQRRKKALEYEMEVRKRRKEVEVKSGDLEDELKELKQGGSRLIEGRGSPRPPRAS